MISVDREATGQRVHGEEEQGSGGVIHYDEGGEGRARGRPHREEERKNQSHVKLLLT